jgi:hypothetical protein
MARMGRRTITSQDVVVSQATNKTLAEEMTWFYETVKSFRGKITPELVAAQEAKIEGAMITHLTDICELFDWQKGRDKDKRNQLAHLAHLLLHAHNGSADTAVILFSAMKRGLKDDFKDPMDLVLSKKESRKARKLRKTLAKNGVDLAPKTNDAKVAARKERQRIRKEAKRLGITTAEYKARTPKV